MASDFHDKSFDGGSLVKLEILEDYLTEWMPVFQGREVKIFDWFCGPGRDKDGKAGSPVRIFNVISKFKNIFLGEKISIWFNDVEDDKIESCKSITPPDNVQCKYSSQNYEKCLDELAHENTNCACFFFVDPTGIIDYRRFFTLFSSINTIDFLLFIPAGHIQRFYTQPGFDKKLPNFPHGVSPKNVPKEFCGYCKKQFDSKGLHLAPFAIQKQASHNVHGLVFGSKHLLGLDKFLRTAWKKSKNGEANFDLEGDLPDTGQLTLLPDLAKPNKISAFADMLRREVLSGKLRTNHDIYVRTISTGFLPRHAKEVLAQLKKENKILEVPGVNYESVKKPPHTPLKLAPKA